MIKEKGIDANDAENNANSANGKGKNPYYFTFFNEKMINKIKKMKCFKVTMGAISKQILARIKLPSRISSKLRCSR